MPADDTLPQRFSAMRIIDVCEYLRTLEVLEQFGWSPSRCIPHGGIKCR